MPDAKCYTIVLPCYVRLCCISLDKEQLNIIHKVQ